jgi:hypothetical protein
MENPDFDRLFPCIRNDEVSFRTTYTPLAQEEMVNLINNHNDNYSVSKKGLLTVVNNRQNIDLYYYANRYYKHFDLLALKDEFITFNTSFFNDIYFLLAPLLLIPIYIQTKYRDISNGTNGYSCFTMESKLNLQIDNNRFIHPESKTENILKVKHVSTNENSQTDEVTAYGYRTRLRVVIVPVMDLEAGLVNVPVTVIDYIPVSQSTTITTEIKQDEINAEDRKKMNFA